ncbi:MAG TPA: YtxH domain-containing protein [Gemmatimonadaceae bacterium]|nr:YtxH domain-containing protein [Gemmatimonadaceae bacterium]
MSYYEFEEDEPFVVIEKNESGVGTFLLGVLAGAAVALLFAPRTGVETRAELTRAARRAQESARDMVDDVAESLGETIETARTAVERKVENARGAVEVKRSQVSQAIEAGREAARQAREDLEVRIAETKAQSTRARSGSSNQA